MPRRNLSIVGRLLAVVVCLLLAQYVRPDVIASAQPGETEAAQPLQISSEATSVSNSDVPVDSEDPGIAVCNDGTIHVVWVEDGDIWHRTYNPDSGWDEAAPVQFTGGQAQGLEPAIAVSSDCVLHLVWSRFWWGDYEIFHTSNDGTGFLIPSRVSRTENGQSVQPAVAVDSAGDAHVIWVDTVGGRYQLYEGRPVPSYPGRWSNNLVPTTLDGQAQVPAFTIDHDDRYYVVWSAQEGRASSEIYYKDSTIWDAGWQIPISQTPNAFSRLPDIAIDDHKIVVAWQEDVNGDDEIFVAWRGLGEGPDDFTIPNNLSLSDAPSRAPALAADDQGRFVVVWDEGRPTDAVMARWWPGSGKWWHTQAVTAAGVNVRNPAIAVSPEGDHIYGVWVEKDSPEDTWDVYFSDIELDFHYFYLTLIAQGHEQ